MRPEQRAASYTAASALPIKLLHAPGMIRGGRITPYHLQLCPTNRCMLSCPWCSCSERDKKLELSEEEIVATLEKFADLGCKSVTITGGGEPLLHPQIRQIAPRAHWNMGLKLGLVTNGVLVGEQPEHFWSAIQWVRVSMSDDRPFSSIAAGLHRACGLGIRTDWALSYVLTSRMNIENIAGSVEFADRHEFTHVRIVSDLLDLAGVPAMAVVKQGLKGLGVDDSLVIYQDRQEFTRGKEKCLISLLRPVVGADGYLYSCCGAQYLDRDPARDFPSRHRMGHVSEIQDIWGNQKNFDGSVCARCYYDSYNQLLAGMVGPLPEHGAFV